MRFPQRAKQAWHGWPMLFTYGVAIYFILAAITLSVDVPEVPTFGNDDEEGLSATTDTSEVATQAGALGFRIVAFRIVPDRENPGAFNAEFTVEVENNTSSNVDLRTDALTLRNGYGDSAKPYRPGLDRITISPQIDQLVPVGFRIEPVSGSQYTLLYQGKEVFTGFPR